MATNIFLNTQKHQAASHPRTAHDFTYIIQCAWAKNVSHYRDLSINRIKTCRRHHMLQILQTAQTT